ncbi:MAG: SOS response-associated peptidase family protein [Burkholderiales bacterium]
MRGRFVSPEEAAIEHVDPATGEIKPAKQPHYIRRADGRLFCFAGLMSYWKNPQTGEPLVSCAILTTAAAGALAQIHGRAPVVLPESARTRTGSTARSPIRQK